MMIKKLKLFRCRIVAKIHRNIDIGSNSTFGRGTVLWAPNHMSIGKNVYIGKYCTLQADIEIGDNVEIANSVGLIGKYDHDYTAVGKSIKDAPWIGDEDYDFKGKNQKIIIEDDVWIGFGTIVLTGVTVHRGAIVAAGSIVLKDVEPYTIVAGNPAKTIARRFTEEQIIEHEKLYKKG